ncbi:MAG: alpha-L-fucosidase [Sphingobacteriaceae bacterium]|jgi:alpha-L-fucosidase|nr:alpha-L-fucosidase [Sphingobacteriaceae bacterium]
MKLSFLSILLFLSAFSLRAQPKLLNKESDQQFANRMRWFTQAKFGMFVHFGLYSQLGGVWKGQPVEGYSEWIQANADIPPEEYAHLADEFDPVNFNADSIVSLAKRAGMKYLVVTAKHHDGFCLWDSKYTNFDVASTQFKRDILKELSDACKKQNLRLGTYYSIIDWHHSSQEENSNGKNAWERWGQVQMKAGERQKYIDFMKNQVRELIENYDTDIMWFDGDWVKWWDMEAGMDLYNYIRRLKPGIIINNRVAKRELFQKDFGTPEQSHFNKEVPYKWEACYTMNNSWGFKAGDSNWKPAADIYQKLLEINSKGGNLLLNVGPDDTGNIPDPSVDILLKVGEMLSVHPD